MEFMPAQLLPPAAWHRGRLSQRNHIRIQVPGGIHCGEGRLQQNRRPLLLLAADRVRKVTMILENLLALSLLGSNSWRLCSLYSSASIPVCWLDGRYQNVQFLEVN